MTESSRFWNSNDIGDGPAAGYGHSLIASWLQKIFSRASNGIFRRVSDELEVTGAASPLNLAAGCAIVDGMFYENDEDLDLTVSSPIVGTTGGLVVLRADWTAQEVRADVVLSEDGDSDIPDPSQTPGTLFEITIAEFQIQTDGAIVNLLNSGDWAQFSNSPRAEQFILDGFSVLGNPDELTSSCEAIAASSVGTILRRDGTALGFGQIEEAGLLNGAVSSIKLAADLEIQEAMIEDGAVTGDKIEPSAIDDTKAGDRVPQFYRRQGGSSTYWNTPGADTHLPGKVFMLGGTSRISLSSDGNYAFGNVTITLPIELSRPLLFVSLREIAGYTSSMYRMNAYAEVLTNATIRISFVERYGAYPLTSVDVCWLAIGPTA